MNYYPNDGWLAALIPFIDEQGKNVLQIYWLSINFEVNELWKRKSPKEDL